MEPKKNKKAVEQQDNFGTMSGDFDSHCAGDKFSGAGFSDFDSLLNDAEDFDDSGFDASIED